MSSHQNHRRHHYLKAYNLNIYLDLHIHINNTMAIIKYFFLYPFLLPYFIIIYCKYQIFFSVYCYASFFSVFSEIKTNKGILFFFSCLICEHLCTYPCVSFVPSALKLCFWRVSMPTFGEVLKVIDVCYKIYISINYTNNA